MAASSIALAASKRLASLLSSSAPKLPGVRELHASSIKQMAYDDYIHAEHMYNLPAMKHRKLKMGIGVFGVLAIGTFVPIGAVIFQQRKAKMA